MNLLEREAQKKECPFKFARDPDKWGTYCVASECMAWRLAVDADDHYSMRQVAPPTVCATCSGTGAVPAPPDGGPESCCMCDGEGKIGHYKRTGYCGLAGRPEN
jgi:hypothetical protein